MIRENILEHNYNNHNVLNYLKENIHMAKILEKYKVRNNPNNVIQI